MIVSLFKNIQKKHMKVACIWNRISKAKYRKLQKVVAFKNDSGVQIIFEITIKCSNALQKHWKPTGHLVSGFHWKQQQFKIFFWGCMNSCFVKFSIKLNWFV